MVEQGSHDEKNNPDIIWISEERLSDEEDKRVETHIFMAHDVTRAFKDKTYSGAVLNAIGGRKTQQDGVVVGENFFAVVDGMGGQGDGKKAAEIVLNALSAHQTDHIGFFDSAKKRIPDDKSGACYLACHMEDLDDGMLELQIHRAGDVRLAVQYLDGNVLRSFKTKDEHDPDNQAAVTHAIMADGADKGPTVEKNRIAGKGRMIIASDGLWKCFEDRTSVVFDLIDGIAEPQHAVAALRSEVQKQVKNDRSFADNLSIIIVDFDTSRPNQNVKRFALQPTWDKSQKSQQEVEHDNLVYDIRGYIDKFHYVHDPYILLGLRKGAAQGEIDDAYKGRILALANRRVDDLDPDLDKAMFEKVQDLRSRLQQAYENISRQESEAQSQESLGSSSNVERGSILDGLKNRWRMLTRSRKPEGQPAGRQESIDFSDDRKIERSISRLLSNIKNVTDLKNFIISLAENPQLTDFFSEKRILIDVYKEYIDDDLFGRGLTYGVLNNFTGKMGFRAQVTRIFFSQPQFLSKYNISNVRDLYELVDHVGAGQIVLPDNEGNDIVYDVSALRNPSRHQIDILQEPLKSLFQQVFSTR